MFDAYYTDFEAMSLTDRMDMIERWDEELKAQMTELRQVSAALNDRMNISEERDDKAL